MNPRSECAIQLRDTVLRHRDRNLEFPRRTERTRVDIIAASIKLDLNYLVLTLSSGLFKDFRTNIGR